MTAQQIAASYDSQGSALLIENSFSKPLASCHSVLFAHCLCVEWPEICFGSQKRSVATTRCG